MAVVNGVSDPLSGLFVVPQAGLAGTDTVAVTLGLSFGDSGVKLSAVETTITPCGAGYGAISAPGNGVSCAPCAPGQFSATDSWDGCADCSPTTTSMSPGALSCDWCREGTGWDGVSACLPCAVATFSAAPSAREPCQACLSGYTTAGDGGTSCDVLIMCPPRYGWNESAAECTQCPPSTFSNATTHRTPCTPCDPGYTTNGPGAIVCSLAAVPTAPPAETRYEYTSTGTPAGVWLGVVLAVAAVSVCTTLLAVYCFSKQKGGMTWWCVIDGRV